MNYTIQEHYNNMSTSITTSYSDDTPIGNLIVEHNDNSRVFTTCWSKLSKFNIKNWSLNRPHDVTRIPEIKYQLSQQEYVDGIIYLAYDNIEKTFICYDGIHRIEALKCLNYQEEYHIDHKIIIHLYPVYNEQQIKYKFDTLNKCKPVPEIYTSSCITLENLRKMEGIVKHFTDTYSKMFVASDKPRVPHENRDVFNDKLNDLFKELDVLHFSQDKLIRLVEEFNNIIKERRGFLKLTAKQSNKCDINNCFIFASKKWEDVFSKLYYNNVISVKRF
jgi:hypothetical protein